MSDYGCGAIKLNDDPNVQIKASGFSSFGFWFMGPLNHVS